MKLYNPYVAGRATYDPYLCVLDYSKMEIKVVLLLTVLASLAFATEEIKRARLEVGMI